MGYLFDLDEDGVEESWHKSFPKGHKSTQEDRYMGATAFLYILLSLWVQDAAAILGFRRSDFPQDFVFGSGTSAYQVS